MHHYSRACSIMEGDTNANHTTQKWTKANQDNRKPISILLSHALDEQRLLELMGVWLYYVSLYIHGVVSPMFSC